jgi:hypothetical protein
MGPQRRSIIPPAAQKQIDIARAERPADCSEPNLLREARHWRREWQQKRYSRLRQN